MNQINSIDVPHDICPKCHIPMRLDRMTKKIVWLKCPLCKQGMGFKIQALK